MIFQHPFLTGVCRTVDLPGLVVVPCVVRELLIVFGVPTQHCCGLCKILEKWGTGHGIWTRYMWVCQRPHSFKQ